MQEKHHNSINSRSVSHHARVGKRFKKTTLLLIVAFLLLWIIFIIWRPGPF